jgi:hypothetical protein
MTLKAFVVAADPTADQDALARELQDYVKAALLPYKYRPLSRTMTREIA